MKVGDVVIDKNNRVGYIKNICKCMRCMQRGFNEPEILWINESNKYDFISYEEYKNGLEKRFKRIGDIDYISNSDITVKTVDNIIITAPKNAQIEMERTVEDKYMNNFLYKKECGEKIVKITGLTSNDKPFEISFCGDYKLEVKFLEGVEKYE